MTYDDLLDDDDEFQRFEKRMKIAIGIFVGFVFVVIALALVYDYQLKEKYRPICENNPRLWDDCDSRDDCILKCIDEKPDGKSGS